MKKRSKQVSKGTELKLASRDEEAFLAAQSDTIDKLEARLMLLPQAEHECYHEFTPGIYARTAIIEAGMLFVTSAHKVDHPFVFSEGRASVWTRQTGWVGFEAVKMGITKAGTRRVVVSHTRTVMTTFHPNPTNTRDIATIGAEIYFPVAPSRSLTALEIDEIDRFIFVLDVAVKKLASGGTLGLPALDDPKSWESYLLT